MEIIIIMKETDAPEICPKCFHRQTLKAFLIHRPPPANIGWAIQIFCIRKECHWYIIIGIDDINDIQVNAFVKMNKEHPEYYTNNARSKRKEIEMELREMELRK